MYADNIRWHHSTQIPWGLEVWMKENWVPSSIHHPCALIITDCQQFSVVILCILPSSMPWTLQLWRSGGRATDAGFYRSQCAGPKPQGLPMIYLIWLFKWLKYEGILRFQANPCWSNSFKFFFLHLQRDFWQRLRIYANQIQLLRILALYGCIGNGVSLSKPFPVNVVVTDASFFSASQGDLQQHPQATPSDTQLFGWWENSHKITSKNIYAATLTLLRVWLQVAMKIKLMLLPQSTYCS